MPIGVLSSYLLSFSLAYSFGIHVYVAASKKRRILPASLLAGFTFKNRT